VRRVRLSLPPGETLEEMQATFRLLADRSRLLILHALREGEELCVCDVAHVLGASVSMASHHLRRLRDFGLLDARRDGKLVLYSLRHRWVTEVAARVRREAEGG
jgi:ArsR family transcriptional regulator, lead/cadmium/zinc/bismuth-responsive transcriptional repressor